MRACAVFALPSLYEGLPLVLVEAAACGARVVATALPGVADALGPGLGDVAAWVPPPRLRGVDVPEPGDEDRFVAALARALSEALARGPRGDPPDAIAARVDSFRWGAVFARVEAVYRRLLSAPTP
jgi:glycosyltransferase involved in cell wall biosynthesis